MADVVAELQFLFLASVVASLLLFPLVFALGFVYDALAQKYADTPKVIVLYAVTFLGAFIGLFLLELYLNFSLPAVAEAALAAP